MWPRWLLYPNAVAFIILVYLVSESTSRQQSTCATVNGIRGSCQQWLDCQQVGGRFGGYCNTIPQSICCLDNDITPTLSKGCSVSTYAEQSVFQNPSYPREERDGNVCIHVVYAKMDTCAVRVDIESALFHQHGKFCTSNSLTIGNSGGQASTSLCGVLKKYSIVVPTRGGQAVRVAGIAFDEGCYWKTTITQIKCSQMKLPDSTECGISTYPSIPLGEANLALGPTTVVSPLDFVRNNLQIFYEGETCNVRRTLESSLLSLEGLGRLKIVNGNETEPHEFPWQAALLLNDRFFCGGSLIAPQWVLTAAHCVDLHLKVPLVDILTVHLGVHDLLAISEDSRVTRKVARVVLHPNFQTREKVKNDLALLLLDRPVPLSSSIKPVCLPRSADEDLSGRLGLAVGWGRTEEGSLSVRLRKTILPILSNIDCLRKWSSENIEDEMVCAGGGSSGVCNGDSGGPLLINDRGRYILAGIVSFGTIRGCVVPEIPSVFTRVPSYAEWLSMALVE